MNTQKPNCFEKTEAGGAFFIFHQITDELSTIALHPLAYNVGITAVADFETLSCPTAMN